MRFDALSTWEEEDGEFIQNVKAFHLRDEKLSRDWHAKSS